MMETYTAAVSSGPFDPRARTITVEIAPGPASIGTPNGMIPMSSFWMPSAFSAGVSRCWLRRACTMSRALSPSRIPPAVQGGRWRAVAIPGSAAETAGLVTGDQLVRINGRAILDGTDVTAVVRRIRAGTAVSVQVVRAGQPLTIRFTAGTYRQMRAVLTDLPEQTDRMRRIRAGLVTGR